MIVVDESSYRIRFVGNKSLHEKVEFDANKFVFEDKKLAVFLKDDLLPSHRTRMAKRLFILIFIFNSALFGGNEGVQIQRRALSNFVKHKVKLLIPVWLKAHSLYEEGRNGGRFAEKQLRELINTTYYEIEARSVNPRPMCLFFLVLVFDSCYQHTRRLGAYPETRARVRGGQKIMIQKRMGVFGLCMSVIQEANIAFLQPLGGIKSSEYRQIKRNMKEHAFESFKEVFSLR